jgi:hypothetical protein
MQNKTNYEGVPQNDPLVRCASWIPCAARACNRIAVSVMRAAISFHWPFASNPPPKCPRKSLDTGYALRNSCGIAG